VRYEQDHQPGDHPTSLLFLTGCRLKWWKGVGVGGLQPRTRGLVLWRRCFGAEALRRWKEAWWLEGGVHLWSLNCCNLDAVDARMQEKGHASLQPGLLQSRRRQCKDAEGGGGWIHAMMELGAGARRAPWEGDICGGGGMGVW
jgi:hypothetical protein